MPPRPLSAFDACLPFSCGAGFLEPAFSFLGLVSARYEFLLLDDAYLATLLAFGRRLYLAL